MNKSQMMFKSFECDYCGQECSQSFYHAVVDGTDYFCCNDCGSRALVYDGGNTYLDIEDPSMCYNHIKFYATEIFDGYYQTDARGINYINTSKLVDFLAAHPIDMIYNVGQYTMPYTNFRVIDNTLFSTYSGNDIMFSRTEEFGFYLDNIEFISLAAENQEQETEGASDITSSILGKTIQIDTYDLFDFRDGDNEVILTREELREMLYDSGLLGSAEEE